MPSTPAVNCRLLRAQEAGTGDSYETGGDPGAAGPERWAGDVGCWYEESRQRTLSGATQQRQGVPNVYVWRTLVVSADLGIDWQTSDVVTFRRAGRPVETGKVAAVEGDESPPGIPGEVRLTLEAE